MNNIIHYLNTDLDLVSGEDLTELASALKAQRIFALHVTDREDGQWYAKFETETPDDYREPSTNIAAMLDAVESLPGPLKTVWKGCTTREFNIGYDCGAEPWAFNQGLPSELLARMAAVGASLRITLYPDHRKPEVPKCSDRGDGNA